MNKSNETPIYSGASPEKIGSDLESLIHFQDDGVSLEKLGQLIDERLIPHLVQYDRLEFQSLFNFFPEEGAEF